MLGKINFNLKNKTFLIILVLAVILIIYFTYNWKIKETFIDNLTVNNALQRWKDVEQGEESCKDDNGSSSASVLFGTGRKYNHETDQFPETKYQDDGTLGLTVKDKSCKKNKIQIQLFGPSTTFSADVRLDFFDGTSYPSENENPLHLTFNSSPTVDGNRYPYVNIVEYYVKSSILSLRLSNVNVDNVNVGMIRTRIDEYDWEYVNIPDSIKLVKIDSGATYSIDLSNAVSNAGEAEGQYVTDHIYSTLKHQKIEGMSFVPTVYAEVQMAFSRPSSTMNPISGNNFNLSFSSFSGNNPNRNNKTIILNRPVTIDGVEGVSSEIRFKYVISAFGDPTDNFKILTDMDGNVKLEQFKITVGSKEYDFVSPNTTPATYISSTSNVTSWCANEGGSCNCNGTAYYGKKYKTNQPGHGEVRSFNEMNQDNTASTSANGNISCSTSGFGSDPNPNYYKQCYCTRQKSANDSTFSGSGYIVSADTKQNYTSDGDRVSDYVGNVDMHFPEMRHLDSSNTTFADNILIREQNGENFPYTLMFNLYLTRKASSHWEQLIKLGDRTNTGADRTGSVWLRPNTSKIRFSIDSTDGHRRHIQSDALELHHWYLIVIRIGYDQKKYIGLLDLDYHREHNIIPTYSSINFKEENISSSDPDAYVKIPPTSKLSLVTKANGYRVGTPYLMSNVSFYPANQTPMQPELDTRLVQSMTPSVIIQRPAEFIPNRYNFSVVNSLNVPFPQFTISFKIKIRSEGNGASYYGNGNTNYQLVTTNAFTIRKGWSNHIKFDLNGIQSQSLGFYTNWGLQYDTYYRLTFSITGKVLRSYLNSTLKDTHVFNNYVSLPGNRYINGLNSGDFPASSITCLNSIESQYNRSISRGPFRMKEFVIFDKPVSASYVDNYFSV
jgi:hypothetical protein